MIYPSFLHCMAAFLNGREAGELSLDAAAFGQLYRLAKRQSLSGALFLATEHTAMPEAVRDRLRRDGFLTLSAYEDRRALCRKIAARFDALQIAHLYFKGAVVANYYPTPAMRSMGDVDLVIRPTDRDRADAALRELGFDNTSRSGEVWVYQQGAFLLEVHTVVRRFDVASQQPAPYDDLWTDARLQEGHTYRLSDDAELAHAVHHLTAHFSAGGCGLRQVMDVAVLYRRFVDTPVWDAARARLERDGLLRFTQHLLWFAALALDVEVREEDRAPLEEPFAAQFAERLLGGGTFGKDERVLLAAKRREARDGHSASGRWQRLFPTPAAMRGRYDYVARHPWLLPIAYVHRAADGMTKNRRIHQKRRQYAADAGDELQREIALFDALGL